MFWDKFLSLFRKSSSQAQIKHKQKPTPKPASKASKQQVDPTHIGDLGEYKIDVQLRQLPKDTRYVSDILIKNSKSKTGYSQIDHVIITPQALFVIETKNYKGTIKGSKSDRYWRVSNRFNMYNPLRQNYGHIKVIQSLLTGFESLKIVSIVSFTMRCRFNVDPELRKIQSDELVIYDVELSDYVERKLRRIKAEEPERLLMVDQISDIYERITKANITDPTIRQEHNQKAADAKNK